MELLYVINSNLSSEMKALLTSHVYSPLCIFQERTRQGFDDRHG